MKAYKKIGINLHQSHCSIVTEITALLFPNLLYFILPKSLHFFFLFTPVQWRERLFSRGQICSRPVSHKVNATPETPIPRTREVDREISERPVTEALQGNPGTRLNFKFYYPGKVKLPELI